MEQPKLFVGIIHFSSDHVSIINGVVRKKCISFIREFPEISVKTKKIEQKKDEYAILRIDPNCDDKNDKNNKLMCEVVEYLGTIGDINIESKMMEYVCTCNWINTKKMISQFKLSVNIDLTPNRFSYDNVEIYSIDPTGCIDIDDALHCVEHENGYEIGIHIADVSSYILENSIIDNELANRTETLYIPNNNPIHMLHDPLLSETSLTEGTMKRAFSIIINLSKEYEIISTEYKKTIIKVTNNLSYDVAQNMINTNRSITNLYELANHLKTKLSTNFESNFESNHESDYDMHQMVEIYMIYANHLVAKQINNYDDSNVLLRVQNTISDEYAAKYDIGKNLIDTTHQGLQLNLYTHFTSPIRRYADIIVHRQLFCTLNETKLTSIDNSNISHINFNKKFYKQMERHQKTINISHIIGNKCENTIALIKSIDTIDNTILLYIPKYDLEYEYNYNTNNKLLSNTYNINAVDNAIIITNLQTDDKKTFSCCQEINIKMVVSINHYIKLKIELID